MGTREVPHSFSIEKARKAQRCLARKIITEDKLPKEIGLIAGVDAAYAGNWAVGAAAVLNYSSLEVLEIQTATVEVKFPYVPTLFSFRELPAAMACIRKLRLQPDVFLVDGHGRAHPFGCGFASHLGVVVGKPTVGVAKSRLVGERRQVGEDVFLMQGSEILGAEVITRAGAKPVYVSVGNMVSLQTAVEIVKHCSRSRVPEPIRIAHRAASEGKAKIASPT
jgi:deoxyribonuclease V